MKNRREFLQTAATGAMLLGSQSKLGLAAILEAHAQAGKSRVVVARDASLHGQGTKPDEKRVLALLDKKPACTAIHGMYSAIRTACSNAHRIKARLFR